MSFRLLIFNLLLIVASGSRPYFDVEPLDADYYAMDSLSPTRSQAIEAECSTSYKALVVNLLKNSTNFFNMQMTFFPADGTTPDFIIVTYHYNPESNVSSPDVNETVWFWSSAVYFFYHPIKIFQFTSLAFSDPLLQQSRLELFLPAQCSGASNDSMQLLTQRLKLHTMYQKLHAPIDNRYRANSHSVDTLIQWHKDHSHVGKLVLSAQCVFPFLTTVFMILFFIYAIELEPRNIGRKLNNQINSSVDYISASGEAKILIILTISVLFNACALLADGCAFKEYYMLDPEVKKYYNHSLQFQYFYIIPCLMTTSDILSLLFIIIPVVMVVCRYYRKYTCIKARGLARQDRDTARGGSRENLLEEEDQAGDGIAELGQRSEVPVTIEGEGSATTGAQDSHQDPASNEQPTTVDVRSKGTATLNTNDETGKTDSTTTVTVNWSILLYSLLSPFSCIATHAYHVIIAFIDNAYHASSILLLYIIVLFIHVVVFQKIYYYVFKWRNSKKHSDCCKNFCWTMFILCCYLVGVITLAVIIGLTVSLLILLSINNAFDNAPTNIYIIYQGSVAVIAALVTFQVFFRATNSIAEVFIKAREKMLQERSCPTVQGEGEHGARPDSKDDSKWESMSEKEKELNLAKAFLEYVFRKTKRSSSSCDTQTSATQTDPPVDPTCTPRSSAPAQSTEEPKSSKSGTPNPPLSAASQPQEISGGSARTASPVPPIQPQPEGGNGQEEISSKSVSPKNESRQEVTTVEVYVGE